MTALPSGWRRTTLGETATLIRNGLFASRPTDDATGTRILRISAVRHGRVDLTDSKHVPGLTAEQIQKYSLQEGDLLFTRYNGSRALVGISGLVPRSAEPVIHPDKLIRVQLPADVDAQFVNFQMEAASSRTHIEARIKTTAGQSGISGADLRATPLLLPDLREQRRIVDILEDHLSRLDAAEALRQASAARLTALRRSSLAAVIDRQERSRVPLGELVSRVEAGKSFGGSAAPARPDEWGIVKVSAMTWGAFRADQNKAVPADKVDPRFEIRSGDLLVSRANTTDYVGASVLVGDVRPRLLLSDKSLRVVPRDGIKAKWLQLALSTPVARSRISALATGTKESMRNISQSNLLSVPVPDVSQLQQAADVAALDYWFQAIDRLRTSVDALGQRSTALRRGLLAAAFSGRLTGRSSDIERVEELAMAGLAS